MAHYDHFDLNKMVSDWLNEGLKPRTIKQCISIASRYHEFCKGTKHPDARALTSKVSRMVDPDPPKALTKEQAAKLLEIWEKYYPKHMGVIVLGLHAGLRIGEVFGLQWSDVDFVKGELRITRSYDGPTKSGKGRLIPMSNLVEQTLQKTDNYVGRHDEEKVFKRINVNKRLRVVCKKADLPVITFHNLRHTFATWALESGTNIKAVSVALGHSSVKVTLDIYWHLLQDRLNMEFLD